MTVKAVVAQKLVQEKFDLLMLQAFHLNLVSLRRNAALSTLDMFSKKVYSNTSLVGKLSKIYSLLFLLRLSNGF